MRPRGPDLEPGGRDPSGLDPRAQDPRGRDPGSQDPGGRDSDGQGFDGRDSDGRRLDPLNAGRAVLRLLLALGVLGVFLGAGTLIVDGSRLPVPGSVLGMVLLTGALQLRWIRLAWVRPAADLLLRHMGLLFVPPGVAVMVHAELIRAEWLPIVVGSAVSTVAVLVVVGRVQQRLEPDA
jgi:holin-like protein